MAGYSTQKARVYIPIGLLFPKLEVCELLTQETMSMLFRCVCVRVYLTLFTKFEVG